MSSSEKFLLSSEAEIRWCLLALRAFRALRHASSACCICLRSYTCGPTKTLLEPALFLYQVTLLEIPIKHNGNSVCQIRSQCPEKWKSLVSSCTLLAWKASEIHRFFLFYTQSWYTVTRSVQRSRNSWKLPNNWKNKLHSLIIGVEIWAMITLLIKIDKYNLKLYRITYSCDFTIAKSCVGFRLPFGVVFFILSVNFTA